MTINSNEDDESFIERCPHDEENPYTQILNSLIRDASLSPDCRWLLIYLLSNSKNWKISITQIVNHLKPHRGYSRNSIYKLINEAIDAGYMKREQINKGKFGKVRYFLSERPKFKKELPRPQFQEAEISLAENSEHKKEQELKKEQNSSSPLPPKKQKEQKGVEVDLEDFGTLEEIIKYMKDMNMMPFNAPSINAIRRKTDLKSVWYALKLYTQRSKKLPLLDFPDAWLQKQALEKYEYDRLEREKKEKEKSKLDKEIFGEN
jgi:hypothetical protein